MKTIASVGVVVDNVLDVVNRTGDSDLKDRLYKETAKQYLRLCAMHPFEAFRRTKTYAADDDNLLPANTCGVRWVVDENDIVYTERDSGPATKTGRRFVVNTITSIPDSSGFPFTSDDGTVNTGENTFTSSLLAQAITASKIPDGIAVTGAGVLNGTYSYAGTINAKPYFEYSDGGVTARINYSDNLGAWIYSESDTGYEEKYGIVSDADMPDESGYVTIPGGATTDITLTYTLEAGITAVGEFVAFGGTDELFKITAESGSTFTIDRTFRGTSIANDTIYVRPPTAQNIALYDENGEEETSVAYTVYYWIIPPSLHRSTDLILLPSSEALELILLRATPEAKEKRPVNRQEIDNAVSALKRMNPDNVPGSPKQREYAGIGAMDTGSVYRGTRR